MLLNNEWVNNEIKEEIKKYLETNENEQANPQTYWTQQSSSKREVHSITGLPKEYRKISNKQPNSTPKSTRKQQQTKPRVSRRKK